MSENTQSQPSVEREVLSPTKAINDRCPWSGKPIREDSLSLYKGHVIGFCNPGCRDKFDAATGMFDERIADMEKNR